MLHHWWYQGSFMTLKAGGHQRTWWFRIREVEVQPIGEKLLSPFFHKYLVYMSADFGLPGACRNIPPFMEWCHFGWSNQGVPSPHPRNRENPANESVSFESAWFFWKWSQVVPSRWGTEPKEGTVTFILQDKQACRMPTNFQRVLTTFYPLGGFCNLALTNLWQFSLVCSTVFSISSLSLLGQPSKSLRRELYPFGSNLRLDSSDLPQEVPQLPTGSCLNILLQ